MNTLFTPVKFWDVAFWLSAEDHIMASQPSADGGRCFIVWRAPPCVVIGRNQILEAEVNLTGVNRRNVAIVRRASGGGAVYIDPGAIQYAVIQPFSSGQGDDAMKIAREQVAGFIASVLTQFGVPATVEGRNDITATGAKISGMSQYAFNGWLNTHGTLLYDTDLDILSALLNPDADKFTSKAVRSVRSRVTNIKPFINRDTKLYSRTYSLDTADGFMHTFYYCALETAETSGRPFFTYQPDDDDLDAIYIIRRERYANPANTFFLSPPYTVRASRRFPEGNVEFFADIRRGHISSCAIRGDFIGARPVIELENALCGLPFRRDDLLSALGGAQTTACLGGVTASELISLLFDES